MACDVYLTQRYSTAPQRWGASSLPKMTTCYFTQDDDLLREAAERQRQGVAFAGVIYGHQLKVTIGQCIRDLELIAKVNEPEDCANQVEYLPLE